MHDQRRAEVAGIKTHKLTATFRVFIEKQVMLQIVDNLWKEHLATMDHLRQGIHLRGYAQKNPKQEYKREAFELFQELLENMKRESIRILSHVKVRQEEDVREMEEQRRAQAEAQAQQSSYQHAAAQSMTAEDGGEGSEVEAPEALQEATETIAADDFSALLFSVMVSLTALSARSNTGA